MEAKHIALVGAMCGAIGAQMLGLEHGWHDALTPQFIGTALVQLGITIGAVYIGPPTPRNTT